MGDLGKKNLPINQCHILKRFEEATSRPYGCLVVDLESSTPEQDRLRTNIFESQDQKAFNPSDEENMFDGDDTSSTGSIYHIHELGPPSKRRKLGDERSRPDI